MSPDTSKGINSNNRSYKQALGFHGNDRFWYCVVTVTFSALGTNLQKITIFPLRFLTSSAIDLFTDTVAILN